jgi:hypothetical protein
MLGEGNPGRCRGLICCGLSGPRTRCAASDASGIAQRCVTDTCQRWPADGTRRVPSMSPPVSSPAVVFSFLKLLALLDTDHLRSSPIARVNGTLTDQALANTLKSNRFLRGILEYHDRRNRSSMISPFSVSPLASLPPSPSPRPSPDRGEAKVKAGGKTPPVEPEPSPYPAFCTHKSCRRSL